MQLHTIDTGLFKLDGGAMHGIVPKSMWNKVNPADENNMCTWAMRCLLIEQDNRLILIDTGIGNKQNEKFFSHYFLHGNDTLQKSIEQKGYSMNDITDVFLTHLHFDHVGGAVRREGESLLPTFANATYWTHQQHWNWAMQPNDREKASFLKENLMPLQDSGQLKFIDAKDGDQWIDGIKIRLVNGHTEAMMLPQISYKDQTILYAADLLPSMHHISLPWIMGYDVRPLETLNEKINLLGEAEAGKWLLFFEHDAINELCSLQQTEKGIRPLDTLKMAEV